MNNPQRAFGQDRVFYISDALEAICPGAKYHVIGDPTDEANIHWFDTEVQQPNSEQIKQKLQQLQQSWQVEYIKILRAKEYPDITEYLDAVVKGDGIQLQSYIDKCLAVKQKYPKPE